MRIAIPERDRLGAGQVTTPTDDRELAVRHRAKSARSIVTRTPRVSASTRLVDAAANSGRGAGHGRHQHVDDARQLLAELVSGLGARWPAFAIWESTSSTWAPISPSTFELAGRPDAERPGARADRATGFPRIGVSRIGRETQSRAFFS